MIQMVEINLSLITEEKLRKKATSRGLPLGEYIEELARETRTRIAVPIA